MMLLTITIATSMRTYPVKIATCTAITIDGEAMLARIQDRNIAKYVSWALHLPLFCSFSPLGSSSWPENSRQQAVLFDAHYHGQSWLLTFPSGLFMTAPTISLFLQPRVRTEDEPLKERALALAEQLADGKEALEALILQKRRLSSFLLTPPDAESKPLRGEDRDEHLVRPLWPPSAGDRLVANVPASVSPDSVHGEIEHLIGTQTVIDCEAATYPVYFLPKVMLPAQDDQLMHQEDSCDKGIDDARDEWDATAAPLQNELGEILTTLASRRSRSRSPRRTSAAPRERERT